MGARSHEHNHFSRLYLWKDIFTTGRRKASRAEFKRTSNTYIYTENDSKNGSGHLAQMRVEKKMFF